MTPATAIDREIDELDVLFGTTLAAAVPNPAALVFTDLALDFNGKRDLLFAIGLLNEGENEAALIAGLARDALRRAPGFDVAHLAREAWYYLRTSIDPAWQLDAGAPSLPAVLAYLAAVLRERSALLTAHPPAGFADPVSREIRAALLRELRDRLGGQVQ